MPFCERCIATTGIINILCTKNRDSYNKDEDQDTSFLADRDLLFLWELGQCHAEDLIELLLGIAEDSFELPAGVRCHDCQIIYQPRIYHN